MVGLLVAGCYYLTSRVNLIRQVGHINKKLKRNHHVRVVLTGYHSLKFYAM